MQYQQLEHLSPTLHHYQFMIAHPPADLKGTNYIVCWPKEVVFQKNRQFVGFIMPLAFPNSRELYELCTPNNKLPGAWQQKYDRTAGNGVLARMKLCTNLAASVYRVHSLNQYVFADMKPQNILVTDDSKVSLIDLDSIQISENNQIIFPALVSTMEYEPPESEFIKARGNLVLEESWDRFSIAVIFYEILFGIHPYTASFSGQYQSCNAISEYILKNLFVHGTNKKYVTVLPPPHSNFEKIPDSLQSLFVEAFNSNPAQRPSVEGFGKVFYKIASDADKQAFQSRPFPSSPPIQTTTPPLQPVINPITVNVPVKHNISAFLNKVFIAFFVVLIMFVIQEWKQEQMKKEEAKEQKRFEEEKKQAEAQKQEAQKQAAIAEAQKQEAQKQAAIAEAQKQEAHPMVTCGETSFTTNVHKDMWYSVYVSSSVGLDKAKTYCEDAYELFSEILNTKVIQLASFLNRSKAFAFANEIKGHLGEGEVGGFLVKAEEHISDFIESRSSETTFEQNIANLPKAEHPQDKTAARQSNDVGINYLKQDDYMSAISSFLNGYKKDQADAEILSNLGFAYYMNSELENARKNALLSIVYSPRRVASWALLGEVYAKKGRQEMAVRCFSIAYNFSKKKDKFLKKGLQALRPGEDNKVREAINKTLDNLNLPRN